MIAKTIFDITVAIIVYSLIFAAYIWLTQGKRGIGLWLAYLKDLVQYYPPPPPPPSSSSPPAPPADQPRGPRNLPKWREILKKSPKVSGTLRARFEHAQHSTHHSIRTQWHLTRRYTGWGPFVGNEPLIYKPKSFGSSPSSYEAATGAQSQVVQPPVRANPLPQQSQPLDKFAIAKECLRVLAGCAAGMRTTIINIDKAMVTNSRDVLQLVGMFAIELQETVPYLQRLVQDLPSGKSHELRGELRWPLDALDLLYDWCKQQSDSGAPQVLQLAQVLEEMCCLLGGTVPQPSAAIPVPRACSTTDAAPSVHALPAGQMRVARWGSTDLDLDEEPQISAETCIVEPTPELDDYSIAQSIHPRGTATPLLDIEDEPADIHEPVASTKATYTSLPSLGNHVVSRGGPANKAEPGSDGTSQTSNVQATIVPVTLTAPTPGPATAVAHVTAATTAFAMAPASALTPAFKLAPLPALAPAPARVSSSNRARYRGGSGEDERDLL